MPIDNVQDIEPRVQYTASSGQTVFDYPFPILADADLVVYDNDTEQTLSSDYTVTGAGDDNGGSITFTSGRTAGHIITIYRDSAIERLTDFQQNGPRRSADMNDELDRIALWMQQLRRDIGRTLRMSLRGTQLTSDLELSPISNWTGRFLRFDSNGVPEPAAVLEAETLSQSVIGQFLHPQTSAESAAGVVPVDFAYEPGNVKRYGAVGDGVTDDTAAIQAALSVISSIPGNTIITARSGGPGHIYFPRGNYVVSDTLYFQYVTAVWDFDAWIYVPSGDFNVIQLGHGANLLYPKVYVSSSTFASACYYISGAERLQSIYDAPTALFPYALGEYDAGNPNPLSNVGATAFHFHSYEPSSRGDSAVSFVRFHGARAHFFYTFIKLESDGSHPSLTGDAYCNSNTFTDFVYSFCRQGIEIAAHDGGDSANANRLIGHMNAYSTLGADNPLRAVYLGSSGQNVIDIQIWDWAVSLPTAIVLDTLAARTDLRTSGINISDVSDLGTNNTIRIIPTASDEGYYKIPGQLVSNGIEIDASAEGFATTLSGFSGTAPSISFRVFKGGGFVQLRVPTVGANGTSNSTTMTTVDALPAAYRPVVPMRHRFLVTDNGVNVAGTVQIGSDGILTFGAGDGVGGFTASGTKGLPGSEVIIYALQ